MESNILKSKNKLKSIKSKNILLKIINKIQNKTLLKIINYNNFLQKRFNLNINNYKEYSEKYSSIIIEIIPSKNKYGKFIKIRKEEDKKYFHIYFNDTKDEINKIEINKEDNASKIIIVMDYQIKSFFQLFYYCECIESIF